MRCWRASDSYPVLCKNKKIIYCYKTFIKYRDSKLDDCLNDFQEWSAGLFDFLLRWRILFRFATFQSHLHHWFLLDDRLVDFALYGVFFKFFYFYFYFWFSVLRLEFLNFFDFQSCLGL